MTPDKLLLKHYGDQVAIAKAAGVSRQAVNNWLARGAISYAASVILAEKMGVDSAKLQVRWVPKTGRKLDARDARKLMAKEQKVKRRVRAEQKRKKEAR